ncbi:MAG: ABC transporter ATP-binding protein [Bacteroidetes bacterium]|nr:MAG: ABC transporter ATP-binding protein [Bacteroidota bacterium]
MNPAIQISGLSKHYGELQALQSVDLSIAPGELFGLIGPDGAGKTSLIRILATLLLPTEGTASVLGKDVVKHYRFIRRNMGYMPGRFSLYYDLSVEENISLFATIFGTTLQENYELVREIYSQIEPFKDRKAGALSGGMKQKLALSCALIHRPKVLFLDEPTTGVDAVSRREFWGMLQNLKAHGITILVSTPYMDEAGLCDRIALIQKGNILAVDSPGGIVSQFERPLYAVRAADKYHLLKSLRSYPYAHSAFSFGDSIHYTDQRGAFAPESLLTYLEGQGVKDAQIEPIQAGVEDCFMALMQRHETSH